jgi:uncharacterized protein YbjT (DUF2867 family)
MKLVVGGTGALGHCITARLVASGERVRVMTRDPARARDLDPAVEIVAGDLLDRDALARACDGCDTVFSAAHSLFGHGANASAHVDGRCHRDLIEVARAAGVRHFVYTSAYSHGSAFDAVPFFRIKRETEACLTASGLSFTILRPTAFMESQAHALIGEPMLCGRRVVLFGRGDTLRNFVAADDVARAAVQALADGSMKGETLDIGGTENLTNRDVVRRYERITGRAARVTSVPLGVARAAATLLRPVHPGMAQVLAIAALTDTIPQPYDSAPQRARLGWEPVTLDAWLDRRLRGALPASALARG